MLASVRSDARPHVAPEVLNGNRRIGLFLPYTPLHHLLLEAVGRPLVLTSGNLADEPLVTDDDEALVRLAGIADAFLAHDRRIRARYDDSVSRVVGRAAGARESIIRRGRGYAPDPLDLPVALPAGEVVLAVGAELKHTFALAAGSRAHVGPHIGDLEDLATHQAFQGNLAHLQRLLALEPDRVAHDLHPGYLSTQFAVERFPVDRRIAVQHHHAHVASCAAEHGITGPFLGIAYDGLGMGDDGTFWGGELLVADLRGYRRFARFGLAPMPGGASAVRKPYRMALGYLLGAEVDGDPADGRGLRRHALRDLDRRWSRRGIPGPARSPRGRGRSGSSSVAGSTPRWRRARVASSMRRAACSACATWPSSRRRRRSTSRWPPTRPPAAGCRTGSSGAAACSSTTRDRPCSGSSRGSPRGRRRRSWPPASRPRSRPSLASSAPRRAGPPGSRSPACRAASSRTAGWPTRSWPGSARDGFDVHINERVPVNDGGICYGQAAVAAARIAAPAIDAPSARPSARPEPLRRTTVMCLGIPGKVIEIRDEAGLRMGRVDFGGVRKEACLAYAPEVELGDYVIVHVGFAISKVDEEEALRTLELLSTMGDLVQQELATMGPGMSLPAVVDDPVHEPRPPPGGASA